MDRCQRRAHRFERAGVIGEHTPRGLVQSDALGEQTPLTFPHRPDITARHRQPGPAPGTPTEASPYVIAQEGRSPR
ncbi:hypothetical protein O1M63_33490 [Streptomyces mirabilis]|nr:hypothetical protein [Streptomyces mirabilis]